LCHQRVHFWHRPQGRPQVLQQVWSSFPQSVCSTREGSVWQRQWIGYVLFYGVQKK
jgi:hypothetical protein